MTMEATPQIIRALQRVKDQQHLTIPQIRDKIAATGGFISVTTLRRVFAPGSDENDNFNYEATIRPIAQALLGVPDEEDDERCRAKIETFEAIVEMKNDRIAALEDLVAFLRHQIDKKDERMDRKDAIIERLLRAINLPELKEEEAKK